jgi:aryl carrier-like protein
MVKQRHFVEAKHKISVFAHKHLAALSNRLKIESESFEAVTPCTPLQEGIIYRQLSSSKPVYLSRFTFELDLAVDISRLKCAWQRAQAHIQLLRTRFLPTNDGYALVVLKNDTLPWFELGASDDEEVESIASRKHHAWVEEFADSIDKPWEVGIVSGPAQRWMCLNVFHALYDGISLDLLLETVARAYHASEIPKVTAFTDILPDGPLCSVPNAESFWVQHLESAVQSSFTRLQGANTDEPAVASLEIGDIGALEAARRKLGVTEQAMIHACWLQTFVQYFEFSPAMGIVVSGRMLGIHEAENVVGPLFNTIPCCIPLTGSDLIADLAMACHKYQTSVLPYQHTPLRDIMKWTRRTPDEPLFDTLFVYQKSRQERPSLADSLWGLRETPAVADYRLNFEAENDCTGSLKIRLVAEKNVLTAEMTEQLAAEFRDTLISFLKDPAMRLIYPGDAPLSGKDNTTNRSMNGDATFQAHSQSKAVCFAWTDTAQLIRQEIAILAGFDPSGIHENTSILEVGLDSIDAIKLSSRLRNVGLSLPVSVIMSGRTIEGMVTGVASASDKATQPGFSLSDVERRLRGHLEMDGYDTRDIEHVLPATPLQEAMFAEMVASGYRNYFNHDMLEIEEHVDIEKLKDAWAAAVDVHPILRTSFAPISEPGLPFSYVQVVHKKGTELNWRVESAGRETIEVIFEEERKEAADSPQNHPLFALRLLRDEGHWFLGVTMAHALYDGWSIDLLHQDVACFYRGAAVSRPSYHKLLEHIIESSGERSVRFWKATLDGVTPVAFPKQPAAGGIQERVHREEITLSTSSSEVTLFCKKQGITAQSLGLACWTIVLAGYLGQLDVVFGTVLLGRDIEDAERILFPAMNSVAIRTILHGTRAEMLQYVQDTLSNIMEHQHFPLRKAKSLANIGGRDIFDTLFIYQRRPMETHKSDKVLYKSVCGSSNVELPVCVEMEALEERIICRVACRDTILGEEDTTMLLKRIERVFREIVACPDEPVFQFTDNGGILISDISITLEAPDRGHSSKTEIKQGLDDDWTPLEEQIRSVLSSVANIPAVEITKQITLFHLGLDSISAIKVSALLKRQGIVLAVSEMLRAGTVPDMAKLAFSLRHNPAESDMDGQKSKLPEDVEVQQHLEQQGMSVHDVVDILPATAGQVYMLEMARSSRGQLYYPSFLHRVPGHVSAETLETSWSSLIRQLPILRTTFLRPTKGKVPHLQVMLRDVHNPIVWREDVRKPLDRQHLEDESLAVPIRLYASHTSDETIITMLRIHHALYDAVSLSHIIRLLGGLCNDGEDIVKAGTVGMADFVAFNKRNSPMEKRMAFWKTYLAGFRTEWERSASSDKELRVTANYHPSLISDITGLEGLGRRYGLTVQALFLAIYGKIHARLELDAGKKTTGSRDDIVVGVYLANRSHPLEGLLDLAAPTLNIVPLRVRDVVRRSIIDLAGEIQSDLQRIGHAENSCVSLIEIDEWTGVRLDTFVNFLRDPDLAPGEGTSGVGATEQAINFVRLDEQELAAEGPKHNNIADVVDGHTHDGDAGMEGERVPDYRGIYQVCF